MRPLVSGVFKGQGQNKPWEEVINNEKSQVSWVWSQESWVHCGICGA